VGRAGGLVQLGANREAFLAPTNDQSISSIAFEILGVVPRIGRDQMMLRNKLSLASALLSIVLLGMITTAQAALAEDVTALIGHSVLDVNIRAMPGLGSSAIAVLPAGEKVTAIGRNPANNWIQIQYGSTTGWVASWVTVYSGDTSLLPVTSDIIPDPVGGPGPFVLTSPFNVNIRSAPSVEASNLGRLPYNAKASAKGRNEAGSWVSVEYQGIRGWVAAWLIILDNDINALPIVSSPGVPAAPTSPVSTVKPAATQGPVSGVPVTQSAPVLPGSGITVQSPARTNIRFTPSLDGGVIDALLFNQTASVVGRNAGNNWLQINRGGTVGWVARWVVVTSNDTFGVSVTSDMAEIGPAPEVITGHGIYDVFIRSGPSLESGQVAVLPPAGKAELVSRTEAANWIKVRYQDVEGWVAAWVIVATADMINLPVE
jgi:uncharacterized protein YraI